MSEKIRTDAKTLPCSVVKDLLPLYVDGLVSEETAREIKAHLAVCEDCRREYQAMTGTAAEEPTREAGRAKVDREKEAKEIDYLKKVKRRNRGIVLAVACVALLVLGAGVMRVFMIGKTDKSVDIIAKVEGENQLSVEARTVGSAMAVSGVDFSEKDGVVTVSARTVMVGLKNNDSAEAAYTAKGKIHQVVDGAGNVLWENGTPIKDYVGRMFANRTQYIGNAPAVSRLVNSVWFAGGDLQLKDGIQLKTDKKPYTLILNTEAADSHTLATQHKHAILLLALIENLDRVEYMYQDPSYQAEIPMMVNAMDSDAALELARKLAMYGGSPSAEIVRNAGSIKDFGKSAYALQALVDVLEKDPDTAELIINEEFFRAMRKLELKLEDLSVVTAGTTVQDEEGNRSVTVDFSNGDVLIFVCRRDRVMISASYLDKAAGLLYSWEEGAEGITVKPM